MESKSPIVAALAMGIMAQWDVKPSRMKATPTKPKRVNKKRKATTAKNKAAKQARKRNRK